MTGFRFWAEGLQGSPMLGWASGLHSLCGQTTAHVSIRPSVDIWVGSTFGATVSHAAVNTCVRILAQMYIFHFFEYIPRSA